MCHKVVFVSPYGLTLNSRAISLVFTIVSSQNRCTVFQYTHVANETCYDVIVILNVKEEDQSLLSFQPIQSKN